MMLEPRARAFPEKYLSDGRNGLIQGLHSGYSG
jgi:hypothetical protein